MDSILNSIKKLLGISPEYTHFDTDIIMHINTVFSTLCQEGIGPAKGFSIIDEEATWDDYMDKNPKYEMLKSFVYLKVRLLFDPPASSAVSEAINNNIKELEWRLYTESDAESEEEEENQNGVL